MNFAWSKTFRNTTLMHFYRQTTSGAKFITSFTSERSHLAASPDDDKTVERHRRKAIFHFLLLNPILCRHNEMNEKHIPCSYIVK